MTGPLRPWSSTSDSSMPLHRPRLSNLGMQTLCWGSHLALRLQTNVVAIVL